MLYFYLWCVFLLCVILSVPLAAYYEKRKLPPLRPMADDEFDGDEPMAGDAFGDDSAGEIVEDAEPLEPAEDDAFGGGGGDEFPEFDEEFN